MLQMNEKTRNLLGVVLFLVFLALCVAGFWNGEAELVLTKAKNICLECIGIG